MSEMARPSIFGSHTNSNFGSSMPSRAKCERIRATQARSSSSERALPSESMGWRWRTFSRYSTGAAPTRCVGESGVTSSGCSASSLRSSSSSAS